jgi:hypothetical protein
LVESPQGIAVDGVAGDDGSLGGEQVPQLGALGVACREHHRLVLGRSERERRETCPEQAGAKKETRRAEMGETMPGRRHEAIAIMSFASLRRTKRSSLPYRCEEAVAEGDTRQFRGLAKQNHAQCQRVLHFSLTCCRRARPVR